MRKTGLILSFGSFAEELREYKFPGTREKFNVFVNGSRTQAARTHGIGKSGDLRNYTYLKHDGRSMYVKVWLDPECRVTVQPKG